MITGATHCKYYPLRCFAEQRSHERKTLFSQKSAIVVLIYGFKPQKLHKKAYVMSSQREAVLFALDFQNDEIVFLSVNFQFWRENDKLKKQNFLPVVFGGKNDEGDNGDVTSAGFQVVVEAGQRLNEDVASFVPKLVPIRRILDFRLTIFKIYMK